MLSRGIFRPFTAVSGRFGTGCKAIFGLFQAVSGSFRPVSGLLEPCWGCSESFWDHFGVVLS
jgi:hypothetical protein